MYLLLLNLSEKLAVADIHEIFINKILTKGTVYCVMQMLINTTSGTHLQHMITTTADNEKLGMEEAQLSINPCCSGLR